MQGPFQRGLHAKNFLELDPPTPPCIGVMVGSMTLLRRLCEGTRWVVGMCSPMLIPRQLRFSLYSGAVITEGWCSLITSLLWFLF